MAINNHYVVCFDFEATHYDPNIAEPVELAACIIHPRRLEVVEGSIFHSYIRPPDIDAVSQDNIAFHAKAAKCTNEEIIQRFRDSPTQKDVWDKFAIYLERYHTPTKRKSFFSAPIRAGQNIINYDNVIWQRLCERYGYVNDENRQNIAFGRDNIDLLNICFLWFENDSDGPTSYSADNLRSFFKMKDDKSHTAHQDVLDCANWLIRFMKLHRTCAEHVNFKAGI